MRRPGPASAEAPAPATHSQSWAVTRRPPASRAEDVDRAYTFQMAVYRAALAQIYPAHRVRCILLWTDGPFILELPPAQLDAALASLA